MSVYTFKIQYIYIFISLCMLLPLFERKLLDETTVAQLYSFRRDNRITQAALLRMLLCRSLKKAETLWEKLGYHHFYRRPDHLASLGLAGWIGFFLRNASPAQEIRP